MTKAQRDKLTKIRANYKKATEADNTNRRLAMADMKFINEPGAQWDEFVRRERGERPCYEFNKLRVTVKRVVNDMRANRPAGKVRAVEDSDKKTADIYEGLCRNIWNNSDGDTVIDQAAEYQVSAGMGAWRISVDYASEDAFDQDIKLEAIRNPFCLYTDPSAEDPMKRDARYWFLTTRISHEAFEEKYGKKAEKTDWEGGSDEFEDDQDWEDEETVRIVEYWYREPVTKTILLLSDGRTVEEAELAAEAAANPGAYDGLQILRKREVQTYKIKNCIASGSEILEEGEWAGTQFPFVMIYGESMIIDGKHLWWGLPRFAKDAQRAYNSSRTFAVEAVSLAPQAKFWATSTQAQGHTDKWAEAHKKNYPYLLYNPDPEAAGPPFPMQGANIPPAIMNEIGISSDDIKGVTGIYDASLGARSNETSGVAIRSRQQQGEIAVFNYGDNLAKGIRRTWELLIDLIPRVYDTQRSLRILGPDGSEDFVEINQPAPDGSYLNDVTRGKYDVTVTIGPSFSTQRQEASEIYMGMAQNNPQIMAVAPDLIFKSLDLPLSDDIAERMKFVLPPQVQQAISKGKAVPPEAQLIMAQATQAMAQVQEMGQALQAQQQEMQNEKSVLEGDKAKVAAEVTKLQAEEKVLAAKYAEAVAKIENAQLRADADRGEKDGESEKVSLSAQLQEALVAIQQQAAEFMTQAAQVMAEIQAKAQPQTIIAQPKAKIFRAQRDEAGNLVGGVIEEM